MNIYLLCEGRRGSGEQQARAFFFKRSALRAAAGRIEEGGEWSKVEDHETSATDFWITQALWMSVIPLSLLFRSWSLKEWFYQRFHWQNLNDRRDGSVGSGWKHGRAWFHRKWNDARNGYGKHGGQICFSWNFQLRWWLGFEMDLFTGDSQRDVGFSLHLGFAHLYLTLERFLDEKYGYPRHSWAHKTGIALFDNHIQVKLHHAGADCFSCKGWKGWHWSDFVSDLIFGSAEYSERVLLDQAGSVSMPEGDYPVSVKLVESVWRRPRRPWPAKMRRAKIECEKGIPHPGKGENSWDCGEDATYGLVCPAESVDEALIVLREVVTRSRERYGGRDWMPKKAII